jgi:hypothetical protein
MARSTGEPRTPGSLVHPERRHLHLSQGSGAKGCPSHCQARGLRLGREPARPASPARPPVSRPHPYHARNPVQAHLLRTPHQQGVLASSSRFSQLFLPGSIAASGVPATSMQIQPVTDTPSAFHFGDQPKHDTDVVGSSRAGISTIRTSGLFLSKRPPWLDEEHPRASRHPPTAVMTTRQGAMRSTRKPGGNPACTQVASSSGARKPLRMDRRPSAKTKLL